MTDVRMHGFTRRHTVEAALAWLDAQLHRLPSESVPLREAAGRVLAESIVSGVDVPGFDRATMDGYALMADATDGATPYNRISFRVAGDALPGAPFDGDVAGGDAVRVMTGAPIPKGTDAVLPAESVDTSAGRSGAIDAIAPIASGKNIGRRGEDIARGITILEAGRVLRPQDLGVMSSVGRGHAPVVRRPRLRIVITGNEVLPPGSEPRGFCIADANGPMLAALAERDGAVVDVISPVRDDADAILSALEVDADVIVVSGGSSVGIEDLAPTIVAKHGELAVHGIAMRPSSPTGMGKVGSRLVFLLPGNPVSALCAYDFFAGRAIRVLGGRPKEWPYRRVQGTLARKISSPIGRVDYARVKLRGNDVEPISVAGASVLSSTTRADGFVIVGDDSEGFPAGAVVDVWLYG
jgi:molybdopterin molybdotransferase